MRTIFSDISIDEALDQLLGQVLRSVEFLKIEAWTVADGIVVGDPAGPLCSLVTLERVAFDWEQITRDVETEGAEMMVGVMVPFTGDPRLLQWRPTKGFVDGFKPAALLQPRLGGGVIVMVVRGRHVDAEHVRSLQSRLQTNLALYGSYVEESLERWESDAYNRIHRAVDARHQVLLDVAALAGDLA